MIGSLCAQELKRLWGMRHMVHNGQVEKLNDMKREECYQIASLIIDFIVYFAIKAPSIPYVFYIDVNVYEIKYRIVLI